MLQHKYNFNTNLEYHIVCDSILYTPTNDAILINLSRDIIAPIF